MATPAKRMRRNSYNQEFEHLYMFANVDGAAVCLLCGDGTRFTCTRSHNLKRHYEKKHAGYNTKYPLNSARRLAEIRLRREAAGLENCVSESKFNLDTVTANRIAFFIAYDIAKKGEPFSNSEVFGKRMCGIFDIMFKGSVERKEIMDFVESIPLSRRSITQKIRLLSANIRHQFLRTLDECYGFSILLDGLTDIKSGEQATVFFRIVFPDHSTKEHLFACIPLHTDANAETIYNALKAELVKTKVPLKKLVSITYDGAATMLGCNDGLITRLQRDPDFPQFTAFDEHLVDNSDVRAIVNYFEKPFDKSVRSFDLINIIAKLHPVDKCRLQYEIEDLRLDDQLKTSSEAGNDIWRIMDDTTYLNLNMVHKRTFSYFGTSLCGSSSSNLKHVKNTLRAGLTDEHLQDVFYISTSTYEPDLDELARGWREHNLDDK